MRRFFTPLMALWIMALTQSANADIGAFERHEGTAADEEILIQDLAKKFLVLQENSKHDGKKVRGTHSKGSCVDGQLEVFGGISELYKVGLFSHSNTYPARIRFANGASTVQPDFVPDARAISVSVDLGTGQRQDFAMNNGAIFPIGSLTDFNFLLDIGFAKAAAQQEALAGGATQEEAEAAGERASYLYLATHPTNLPGFTKVMRLGAELRNQDVDSYRNLKYWSGSAFKYGETQVAKFALTPCQKGNVGTPDKTDPDYLQKDLKDRVNSDLAPVCFDFQVQLLDAENMRLKGLFLDRKLEPWEWVEDVTLDWDAAGATFYSVGRLSLVPRSVYSPEACDDPANGVDVMKNSLPDHRGVGRINRARARSEAASRNNR